MSVGLPAKATAIDECLECRKKQATAIINGGYFDQQDNATALFVSNGKVLERHMLISASCSQLTDKERVSLRHCINNHTIPIAIN